MAERIGTTSRRGEAITVSGIRTRPGFGDARAAVGIADALGKVAANLGERADAHTREEARQAGALAGASGVAPELQDATTIRGQAFNRAAVRTYTQGVELRSRQEITRLYGEYAADPVKLAEQLEAYSAGVANEVEKVDQEAAMAYRASFQTMAAPFVARAKDAAFKLASDAAKARQADLEAQTSKDIDQLAEGLMSDNPEVQAATSAALGAHLRTMQLEMERVDPATGRPLYTEAQKSEASRRFYDRVVTSGVRQWYRGLENKEDALMLLREGDLTISMAVPDDKGVITLQDFNVRQQLSLEALDGLEADLQRDLSFDNARALKRQREEDKAVEVRQELAEFQAWERVLLGGSANEDGVEIPPISPSDISEMVQAGTLKPGPGRYLMEALMEEPAERDDGDTIDRLEEAAYAGEDISEAIREAHASLTPATASRLRALNQRLINTREGGFDQVGEQRKLLRTVLGPGSIMDFEPTDARQRQAEALTEFDRRTSAGEDPIEVRRDLEMRASRGPVLDHTNRLVKPRVWIEKPNEPGKIDVIAAGQRLQELLEAGDITLTEYEHQATLLMQWHRAQAENERLRNKKPETGG